MKAKTQIIQKTARQIYKKYFHRKYKEQSSRYIFQYLKTLSCIISFISCFNSKNFLLHTERDGAFVRPLDTG